MDEPIRNHPVPLAALPEGLDPDSADSLRRFVRTRTFPAGSDGRFLFVFVDEEERCSAVRLRHGLAGHRQPPILQRCAGGLHVIELHATAVNRIEYRLGLTNGDGLETIITDPLNPMRVRDPFADKSVLTTAAYQPPAYAQPAAPDDRGTLRESVIVGPLGNPWPTWVWSPPGVADDASLPVIVFLDGGDWLQLNHVDHILANLVAAGRIGRCRAALLKPAERNEEYAANPRTAAFLADQLPRELGSLVHWPREARDRIAVGCSLGALCLLHAHFTNAARSPFGGLILQSGSFFQPRSDAMETGFRYFTQIAAFVSRALGGAARDAPRIPIHMTCGMGEENDVNNHIMAEALTRQGFGLTFHEQPDAHNWTCWRDCIGGGLMRLLPPQERHAVP